MQPDRLIQGISQISIPVRSMEEAVQFYRDTIGLTLLFQIPNIAFFECSGIRLMLSVAEDAKFDHPSSVFYFHVDNITTAYETLCTRGVSFISEPHMVAEVGHTQTWMALFHDPDQNVRALMSEVAVAT
ncbi:VOC family protein [Paenibacillus popilliae]|uniref:VOC family protein n=1 Tax=Paenibacillus popilliae TaxID=78057 RepID=A0ABY3AND6_PAEPP|nr:VOC family protein [Paenibacillus sp. SDF0028]TQR43999.1 VOC family protein [Paenibacillus sp. SDF0028]